MTVQTPHFNINQGIAERIFGFGTVIVHGTGGGKTPIPSIVDPLGFRRVAMEAIEAAQQPASEGRH